MSAWMEMATGGHYNASSNQAWRDNYNGGWAAGDWTGNHNAAIAWERAAAGEDNAEIRERLPEGLTPAIISGGLTANPQGGGPSGGSGDQGASPSQSGGKRPVVMQDEQVARSARPTLFGSGTLSMARVNFGQSVSDAMAKFSIRGENLQPWDDSPPGHSQLLVNGHKVVHDRGYSTGETAENIYGEGLVSEAYSIAKAFADAEATARANGFPTITDRYNSTNAFIDPWAKAGRDVRTWLDSTYSAADKAWEEMVKTANEAVPPGYASEPGHANPYSGGSPWSMPFN